jgi:hypothetical protein
LTEGISDDVAVCRTPLGNRGLQSAKGLKPARKVREMLATGNSAALPDGTVIPYFVRLGQRG